MSCHACTRVIGLLVAHVALRLGYPFGYLPEFIPCFAPEQSLATGGCQILEAGQQMEKPTPRDASCSAHHRTELIIRRWHAISPRRSLACYPPI